MNKSVTICIPTFNAEKTIAATLDSLVNQSYKNIKIKVFDNCSSDNTQNIVKSYEDKHENIKLFINESNLGGEGNFTKCIAASEGDYTALFHADDIYLPEMVEEQVSVLDAGDIVAVSTHAHTIDMKENITGERFIPYEFRNSDVSIMNFNELLSLTFKYGNFITCPSVMAKSEVYKDQIRIWNGKDYKTSADLDVWLRLAKIGNIAFISRPLMKYRVAEASISFNLKKVRTHRHDIFLVLDKYLDEMNITNKNYYSFLSIKDDALRMLNSVTSHNKGEYLRSFNPFKLRYIKISFDDLMHLKLYIIILGIWIVTLPFMVVRVVIGAQER